MSAWLFNWSCCCSSRIRVGVVVFSFLMFFDQASTRILLQCSYSYPSIKVIPELTESTYGTYLVHSLWSRIRILIRSLCSGSQKIYSGYGSYLFLPFRIRILPSDCTGFRSRFIESGSRLFSKPSPGPYLLWPKGKNLSKISIETEIKIVDKNALHLFL